MISYLRGKVNLISPSCIIIDVNGIGYKVFVSPRSIANLLKGENIEIYTHHQVSENDQRLFGFLDYSDLVFFEKLISISGSGPKTGLGILSASSASQIENAIMSGDVNSLTKISGIGRKTAERIVLELKGKLTGVATLESSVDGDIIEALESLGYSEQVAREAVKAISDEITDSGQRLKEALRKLAK